MGKESAIGESAEAEGDVKDVPMLGAQAAVGNGNNRSNNDGELAIEEEGSVKTERGREEEEKGQQPLAIHRPKSGLPHRLGCTIKKMFSNEDKQGKGARGAGEGLMLAMVRQKMRQRNLLFSGGTLSEVTGR